MSTPRVVVTGDLLLDHNVRRRIPKLEQTYSDPFDEAVGSRSLGGAWYLARLIDAMIERRHQRELHAKPMSGESTAADSVSKVLFDELEDFGHVVGPQRISPQQRLDGIFAKAFTLWQQYPLDRKKENQKKRETWRAECFLGCQKSRLLDVLERAHTAIAHQDGWTVLAETYLQTIRESEERGILSIWKSLIEDSLLPSVQHPHILVIDDQNLGFGCVRELWPTVLRDVNQATHLKHIILKVAGPLRHHALWERLRHFQDRLTVIVTADDLRARGAELKVGFSWDAAIEELNREFQEGASAYDLALCSRVIVLYRGGSAAACYSRGDLGVGVPRTPQNSGLTLQRFLYRPEEAEGAFLSGREGSMFGAASLLTAGVALHELYGQHPTDPIPLFHALGRSLDAIRANHEAGGKESHDKKFSDGLHPDFDQLCDILIDGFSRTAKKPGEAAAKYYTAYPQGVHSPLSNYAPTKKAIQSPWFVAGPGSTAERSDLLGDVTGPGTEYVYAVGVQVVRDGWEKALKGVPHAKYENYVTFDRDEVQRINAVRSLIDAYLNNANDKRPLSIAVFGKPGTGKSFAIKELAKSFQHHNFKTLTFNLSEFPDDPEAGLESFHNALHQVRDETIGGATPLVFWDEFDAGHFRWLKQFLAPMQDHEFRARSAIHQLGRAVFVFAGGTSSTYQEFYEKAGGLTQEKGPDFISRLRGFMNIKGPNADRTTGDNDDAHIIRRAVLLRGRLELDYAHLIDGDKRAKISNDIIRGFLRVKEYRHGARSMESILSMSQLAGRASFERSQLPTQPQLDMHVSSDFLDKINKVITPPEIVETVAEAYYKSYNPDGNYRVLDEEKKDQNRRVAHVAFAKLDEVEWMVDRVTSAKTPATKDPNYLQKLDMLSELEHDRWLREYLIQGYAHEDQGRKVNEKFKKYYRLNINIAPTWQLTPDSKGYDANAYLVFVRALADQGFQIVMKPR